MVKEKLLVIGLDCAAPSLFFNRHLKNIPTLAKIQASGSRGTMRSSDPPITIPAWMCMATGHTPGQLGIYGFRHRKKKTYDDLWIASSLSIKKKTAWEILGEHGYRSIIVGIPPTFPVKPFNGNMITGFITPSTKNQFTHPPSLKEEILDKFGHYTFDVPFRIEDKSTLFDNLMQMTRERQAILEYLITEKPWDMFWFVEIGLDRMHHAFWKYFDENHKDHEPGNDFQDCIDKYERLLDDNVSRLIELVPDDTRIMVVSDHGAQPLMGGFCLNEWLRREGYLALAETPTRPTPLDRVAVNWPETKAWGAGGYYGRVFLNVKGREPEGTIPIAEYERERQALAEKLENIRDPEGNLLGVKAYTPQELYRRARGVAPDLIVYFQEMAWRSLGSVGVESLYSLENDTGPDDANHAQQGLMIFHDPRYPSGGQRIEGAEIYDILPTLLARYQIDAPSQLRGEVLLSRSLHDHAIE
ncbi:sulfatase-like hydrolase/transferase [Candidatus Bathyarchaeota archaeon]|nr:sulfatase-like hydrolase/transferase [Candidatus Bathyarchaeota archaeon]